MIPARRRRRLGAGAALLVAVGALALASGRVFPQPASASSEASAGWARVDYGSLVDRRRLTHSGDSIGTLLQLLGGRPFPSAGERPADAVHHGLLDPLLEPYAFVLSDALDSRAPVSVRTWVEIGALWHEGEAQPAWAELLRSRRMLVESDGGGRLRMCLPFAVAAGDGSETPRLASRAAAAEAFEAAWPVLRHVLAAEQRRLTAGDPAKASSRPIEVEVHPYVHFQAHTLFHLGLEPHRATVTDTRSRGTRPPVDLEAWRRFLEKGLRLEGGRLEAEGHLKLLGSEAARRPSMLGRPIGLDDLAIAHRAAFHGGLAEPYMSLDRGNAPWTSVVNYGGRLQDTSLGLVSLLCDIRFKTFSLGLDIVDGTDIRERLRADLPAFRTHLERLAADPRSGGMSGQQTRLWFYPDEVDLTLSPQGDVLVLRKVRMTASSERVEATGSGAQDPPWTVETVRAINETYDALAAPFSEMADLDQVARLLSLFTWLARASDRGLAVPDLDALLAIELPASPTPRRFPQMLAFNALPPAGKPGRVDVLDRVGVGAALERLRPAGGLELPARRRFHRALAALDRNDGEQAALARELEASAGAGADDGTLDLLSYRAERLVMHRRVLATLAPAEADALSKRDAAEGGVRVFSVGIGGLDLGMGKSLDRAAGRSERLAWGATAGAARAAPGRDTGAADPAAPTGPREAWRAEAEGLPRTTVPEHGSAGAARPIRGSRRVRIEQGVATVDGQKREWTLVVTAEGGPEPRARRLILDAGGRVLQVERLEGAVFLRYRLEAQGTSYRAARVAQRAIPEAAAPATAGPEGLPAGLAILRLADPAEADAPTGAGPAAEPPAVPLRLRREAGTELAAPVPRGLLQRLLLGREVDASPGQPLPMFAPASQLLGEARSLMVMSRPEQRRPPWDGPFEAWPGEEDPARLAAALRDWWAGEPGGRGAAVVGTDPAASPARWASAPRPGRGAVVLLPEDAFPGIAAGLREELAARWKGLEIVGRLPDKPGPPLVVLASAESPAVLGERLLRLGGDPALAGKLLAVFSIGGPVRADLPAGLLAAGGLAGLGLAEWDPAGWPRQLDTTAAVVTALARDGAGDRRVEEVRGPLLWFF